MYDAARYPLSIRADLERIDEEDHARFQENTKLRWFYRPTHPSEYKMLELNSLFRPEFLGINPDGGFDGAVVFINGPACPGCDNCSPVTLIIASPDRSELFVERLQVAVAIGNWPDDWKRLVRSQTEEQWELVVSQYD